MHFFTWYLTLTLLGLLTFPLTYRLFPKLADRGYSFARTIGLLIWAYAFWMLASLGVAQNDIGGILLGLAILVGLSLFAATRSTDESKPTQERIGEAFQWMRENRSVVITVEILFFVAFAFLAFIRAANPEALGTEKPMELAFINAILRSPTFPPRDPWLSGYAISYYHFGYIMVGMLAKLTATAGSVAFNLMAGLVFALSAVGSYGILYNLLALKTDHRPLTTALFAPLFLLLMGNFEALLEILHQNGIFWNANPQNFWTWLDIKELSRDPATLQPIPERFWWWWRASRVVQDYDLLGNFREVIDEFPAFSYVLGDLHPHVLAMPFALLAVAVALYIFRGGWQGETHVFGYRFHLKPLGIFGVALVLGGIAFLNTWDILIAAALIASAYTFARVHADGWSLERLEDFLFFGMLTGIAAILLYLPFYLGFSSQAGGIVPNLINPTRGAHLWVMFGTLFIPLILWLADLIGSREKTPNWKLGIALGFGLPIALWLFSWLMAWFISLFVPEMAITLLSSQGLNGIGEALRATTARRFSYIGGAITLALLMSGIFACLFAKQPASATKGIPPEREENSLLPSSEEGRDSGSKGFILLIAALASLLVLAPEYVYLRDQFGTRMNTIFKFYYQAWILWSIVAAYAAAKLFSKSRSGAMRWVNIVMLVFVILSGLIYPLYGFIGKTNGFQPTLWTLDSAAYIEYSNPDEAAAIAWLKSAPDGVVLEAVGGSYSGYARISTNTGLQTVLGWPGHESQWRGGYTEMGSRQSDIERIYTSNDWATTQELLTKYNVKYIYIGQLERTSYLVNEEKFQRHLPQVFLQGNSVIYAMP